MNVLKSFIDTYETIDGQTIQSLSTSEREAYEKIRIMEQEILV